MVALLLLLFSYWVMSDSATPWMAACQAFLSFTISWSLLKFMSSELVMLSKNLILCCPLLLCLQSFPASESFPVSWLSASGGPRIGASASALPMNIQGWFPLGLAWPDPLAGQGTLKSLLQHHGSKASILWRSALFMVQVSHLYMTIGKTIALTIQIL